MTTAAIDLLKAFDTLSPTEQKEVAAELLHRSVAGKEIYVKRVGRSVLIIPANISPWDVFAASLDQFSEDFMADRMQPGDQQREAVFE